MITGRPASVVSIVFGAWFIASELWSITARYPPLDVGIPGWLDLGVGSAFLVYGIRTWRPAQAPPAGDAVMDTFPDTIPDARTGRVVPVDEAGRPARSGFERLFIFYLKFLVLLPGAVASAGWGLAVLLGCRMSGANLNVYGCAPAPAILMHLALWFGLFFLVMTGPFIPLTIVYAIERLGRPRRSR